MRLNRFHYKNESGPHEQVSIPLSALGCGDVWQLAIQEKSVDFENVYIWQRLRSANHTKVFA